MKVKKRPTYNQFEKSILDIVGSIETGLHFYFNHLYYSFQIAEKAILKESEVYKEWYKNEDLDTKQSIHSHDPVYQFHNTTLIPTLLSSYFVTLHSEFDIIWKNILEIHNKHYPHREKFPINDNYLHDLSSNSCILDIALDNHKILIDYNLIRNKIVHGYCKTISPEYQRVKEHVETGLIKYITIVEEDSKGIFLIEHIKFCEEYGNEILAFMLNIVNISLKQRI